MQFITTLLALAATSSAAVLPRSNQGSWFAQVTVNPDHTVYVNAKFTSDAYPEGLRNSCVENAFSDPPYPRRCDHLEFDYSYDGQFLNLTQHIQLPIPQTVFGEVYLPATQDLGDGRMFAESTVEVTRAIA